MTRHNPRENNETLEARIAQSYKSLSPRLQKAADFVVANPMDVGTQSLRHVARASGFAPATFTRLAQAIGFEGYADLKALAQTALLRPDLSFSEKAAQLVADSQPNAEEHMFHRQSVACIRNIQAAMQMIDPSRLNAVARRLHKSRRVLLYGAFGSAGVTEYLAYMADYFSPNWTLAEDRGAPLGPSLSRLGPRDVLFLVTMPPCARKSVLAAKEAAQRGAYIVVVTNTHSSPALPYASEGFVVPSESPQFFTSYAATLVLLESLIGLLVAREGKEALSLIAKSEAEHRALQDYWVAE